MIQHNNLGALELLATECPFVYGQGVLAARALLMANDGQKRLFVNACELPYQSNAGNRIGGEQEGFVWNSFSDWEMEEDLVHSDSENRIKNLNPNGTRVYPNPFNNQLSIETDGFESGNWFLMDVAGRQILEGVIQGEMTGIDVSMLASGSYLLQVVDFFGKKEQFQIVK